MRYSELDGPVHLLLDTTTIKAEVEWEWKARKRGDTKRHVWRKIHIAGSTRNP